MQGCDQKKLETKHILHRSQQLIRLLNRIGHSENKYYYAADLEVALAEKIVHGPSILAFHSVVYMEVRW